MYEKSATRMMVAECVRENEEVSECMGACVREAIKNQHKKER